MIRVVLFVFLRADAAAVTPQRTRAVGDQGAGGPHHRSVADADHRTQAAVGHRTSGTQVLRLRAGDADRLHISRDIHRHHHYLHREPALLSGMLHFTHRPMTVFAGANFQSIGSGDYRQMQAEGITVKRAKD
jgi:hypothetical protein